ncbi:hypothetical protein ZWY2020_028259 [Hordeum vulgare]|nr:hypothetical protein ZWY2020_028259 [Hordeum vulgare]
MDGDAHGRRRNPNSEPSSSRETEIEDHASEVSNSEGSVTMGLLEFTALALNDMSPDLQSTYWSNVCYDTGSSETESDTVVEKPEEESDFDLEKELKLMDDYFEENTCNTMEEVMVKIFGVGCISLVAEYNNMSAAERADAIDPPYFSKRPPVGWPSSRAHSEAQSLQATGQASRNEPSRQSLLRRQPRLQAYLMDEWDTGHDCLGKVAKDESEVAVGICKVVPPCPRPPRKGTLASIARSLAANAKPDAADAPSFPSATITRLPLRQPSAPAVARSATRLPI